MQTGTINVQTENIFPIIKKFLYSDQEIFLRELISNAIDATQKLKVLARRGEEVGEINPDELMVEVVLDEEAKTLTIRDMGIGMTQEEVDKYINQIAFSSAQEFLEKYKDDKSAVIGHFGLGFYSAFMVSNKVEIHTKSWQDGPAVRWSCEGSPEYTISAGDAEKTRGTDIILHINEEGEEYLKKERIDSLLKKYCSFLPVDIKFGTKTEYIPKSDAKEGESETEEFEVDNIVNNTSPAWTRKPNELEDKDYEAFYRELYPYAEPPLFWIHLNVDYPFELTGVLYFPKIDTNTFEVRKDRIHLYCNQVFVTDHVEEIVPEFLMLLHGVLDSPDIPLNVSRSYLQSDPQVKRISRHITKKVAEKLEKLYKDDRENFNSKWQHINILAKYGMLTDERFNDRAMKFCLLENTEGKFYNIEEYKTLIKETQTDKDGKVVALYTSDANEQHAFIEMAKNKGYDVLKLDAVIDAHFVNHLESKVEGVQFKRVDADTVDKLIAKDEQQDSVLSEEQQTVVKELFESTVTSESKTVNVSLEALSPEDRPVTIVKPEFMRRMQDMAQLGGNDYMRNAPEWYNVIVNTNHPIVLQLLNEEDAARKTSLSKQLYDLALLQQNMLKGADLTSFINRSVQLIK